MSTGSSIEVRVERRKSSGEMSSEKPSRRGWHFCQPWEGEDVFIQQEYSPGKERVGEAHHILGGGERWRQPEPALSAVATVPCHVIWLFGRAEPCPTARSLLGQPRLPPTLLQMPWAAHWITLPLSFPICKWGWQLYHSHTIAVGTRVRSGGWS